MLDKFKVLAGSLTISPAQQSKLVIYLNTKWQEITAQGKEYRLYNMFLALGTVKDVKTADTLVDCIVDTEIDKWGVVENYCYDFYVLNEAILV